MSETMPPLMEAAAFHGLATNEAVPLEHRLACALQALELHEAQLERSSEKSAIDTRQLDQDVEAIGRTAEVLYEISRERGRQDAKWGEQNHPNGTAPHLIIEVPAYQNHVRADHLARAMRERCKRGDVEGDTWERILTEEWAEAISERDPVRLRAELLQVAAVAVAWVEAIDRRSA